MTTSTFAFAADRVSVRKIAAVVSGLSLRNLPSSGRHNFTLGPLEACLDVDKALIRVVGSTPGVLEVYPASRPGTVDLLFDDQKVIEGVTARTLDKVLSDFPQDLKEFVREALKALQVPIDKVH